MLKVSFRGVREEIERAHLVRRGVPFRVQNKGGAHALSSCSGAHDQRTQQRIQAKELQAHDRTRRAIGPDKKEVLQVRLGQVGYRHPFRFKERHNPRLRRSFSDHERFWHVDQAAFTARFADFGCRTGGQHSAALSAQQLSVR